MLLTAITDPADGVATFSHAQNLFDQAGPAQSLFFSLEAVMREPVTL
jgi:hypothetical protein